MEKIVAYCDKTIVKTEDNIKDTETHLENVTERGKYQSIEKSIKNNEANTKRLLQQRKSKKFNCLKYEPNSTTEETLNPNKRPQSRGKSSSRSTSKTRKEPSPRDKEIKNLENKLRILKVSNQ